MWTNFADRKIPDDALCGEDIETTWSSTNPLVPSTREMGPAARRETLNDHWGGWNFRKIVNFRTYSFEHNSINYALNVTAAGPLFIKRFKDAYKMRAKHSDTFNQLSNTFLPEVVSKWEQMVRDWQEDRTKRNPYEEPSNSECNLCLCV